MTIAEENYLSSIIFTKVDESRFIQPVLDTLQMIVIASVPFLVQFLVMIKQIHEIREDNKLNSLFGEIF